MVFIGSDNVMSCNAIVAPEGATFKAIETLGACFVAVSTRADKGLAVKRAGPSKKV